MIKNGNINDELVLIAGLLENSLQMKEGKKNKKFNLEETFKKEGSENKIKIVEKETEDSLENEIEEDDPENSTKIKYSFDQELFQREQFYNKEQIRYEQSLYKQTRSSLFESEEEYAAEENEFHDTEAEILTTEEAEDALIEIQYASVIGTSREINSEKKRKFDMWIKFNPALFKLFEASYALTRNVDYRPLA